jgi:hypothetical protein
MSDIILQVTPPEKITLIGSVETGYEIVVTPPEKIEVIFNQIGLQGLPGEPGDSGNIVKKFAGENLGGHRIVTVDDQGLGKVWYAYNTELSHLHRVLGMTTGAVAEGDEAEILTFGEWHSNTWNWVQYKSIYLGVNGLLTQVVPTFPDSEYLQIIGFPTSQTSMMVRIAEPIILT